jgi:putative transposase
MPDHIHLFVRGSAEFKLGIWIRGLKRAISGTPWFWQPGFFDRVLRTDESYAEKRQYVRDNPVRAQFVSSVDEWPYQGEIVLIDRA